MDTSGNEAIIQAVIQHFERTIQGWLDNQKETLLLQLIGFLENDRHKLEHQVGSGVVQEIEAKESNIVIETNTVSLETTAE